MIRILTIVGARPQIIKAAAISRTIKEQFSSQIQESILHTGQHYDAQMSDVFFDELQIPHPQFHLHVQEKNNSQQCAKMLNEISNVLDQHSFDAVLVYGDTNSTLAGALAASQKQIPLIHIEAGLRSFNKSMPEELNRIHTDHASSFLFVPTNAAIDNLRKEGISYTHQKNVGIDNPLVSLCGDIMYDNALHYSKLTENNPDFLDKYPSSYILATIHRNFNTDNKERLLAILESLQQIAKENKETIIIPLHPRTKAKIDSLVPNMDTSALTFIEPVGYIEMLYLEKNAQLIITDSGGVQKEAYFFHKNCIILRPETEWIEIVSHGSAQLTDANPVKIINAYHDLKNKKHDQYPSFYGNGNAAQEIISNIIQHLK